MNAADEKRLEIDVRWGVKKNGRNVRNGEHERLSPNSSFPRDEKESGQISIKKGFRSMRSTSVDDYTFSKGGGVHRGIRSEGYTPYEK